MSSKDFDHAICIQDKDVAFLHREQWRRRNHPMFEKPDHSIGGLEFFNIVAVQHETGQMTAVGVAQASASRIIVGKEERGVRVSAVFSNSNG